MTPHPLSLAMLLLAPLVVGAETPADRTRTFQFTYAGVVTGLKPGEAAQIWLPVASSSADQDASIVSKELPAEGQISRQSPYDNQIFIWKRRPTRRVRFRCGWCTK